MAKRYHKRPSEILNIDNDYLAYMFDEVALYLESEATFSKGITNWNKIRWQDKTKGKSNKDYIDFLLKQK